MSRSLRKRLMKISCLEIRISDPKCISPEADYWATGLFHTYLQRILYGQPVVYTRTSRNRFNNSVFNCIWTWIQTRWINLIWFTLKLICAHAYGRITSLKMFARLRWIKYLKIILLFWTYTNLQPATIHDCHKTRFMKAPSVFFSILPN